MPRPRGTVVCNEPGCWRLVKGSRWCPKHRIDWDAKETARKREVDGRRPSARARGYDSRWERRRRSFLRRHPRCEDCGGQATVADHVPTREELVARGVADPDADEWLHPKCASHHSQKTAAVDGGFGNPKVTTRRSR